MRLQIVAGRAWTNLNSTLGRCVVTTEAIECPYVLHPETEQLTEL